MSKIDNVMPITTTSSRVKRVSPKRTRAIKVIFKALALSALALIFVTVVFPANPTNVFGFRVFLASGTRSMEPQIRHNDLIVVRRVEFGELEVGDVVTFKAAALINGRPDYIYITHMIIEEGICPISNERMFRTSGVGKDVAPDSRPLSETGTRDTNVYVGKLVFSLRFLGLSLAYLTSPFGITMLVLNTGAIIAVFWILRPDEDLELEEGIKTS